MTQDEQAHLNPAVSSQHRRQVAVDRARSFIDDNLTNRIRLADLCACTHTGARSLEYGFREMLGISPISYIRAMRLSLARDLLSSGCEPRTVTKIALDCGFGHLSQFAIDYRNFFGESPSATLRTARDLLRSSHPKQQTDGNSRRCRCGAAIVN